jgi:Mitochondrial carrier protein
LTTPIDVAKTKLMTQRDGYYKNLPDTLQKVFREEGFLKLFSACHIRVFNLSFGGVVFFGAYETVRAKIVGKTISH